MNIKAASNVNFPLVDALVKMLRASLWGLIVGLVVLSVVWFGSSAANSIEGPSNFGREFYWWLIFPTSLLSFIFLGSFLRGVMRVAQWRRRRTWYFLRWYHPLVAARDWLLVSSMFAVFYFCLMFALATQVQDFSRLGENMLSWWLTRGTASFLSTIVVLLAVVKLQLVTRGAMVPAGEGQGFVYWIYGLLMPVAMFTVGGFLQSVFDTPIDQMWILATGAFVAACSASCLFALVAILVTVGPKGKSEVPTVRLAVVGHSSFGKTLMFVQAYRKLSNERTLGVGLVEEECDETTDLIGMATDFDTMLKLPDPTQATRFFHFTLTRHGIRLLRFRWHDMPGGIFEPASQLDYEKDLSKFRENLKDTDGLMIIISAFRVNLRDLTAQMKKYWLGIDEFMEAHATFGRRGQAATIAITITQCLRGDSDLPGARTIANDLRRYAKEAGEARQIRRVDVRIFEIDSLTEVSSDNFPTGRGSLRVGVPILWLASTVARANLTAVEIAQSSTAGMVTPAIETVSILEELVNLQT